MIVMVQRRRLGIVNSAIISLTNIWNSAVFIIASYGLNVGCWLKRINGGLQVSKCGVTVDYCELAGQEEITNECILTRMVVNINSKKEDGIRWVCNKETKPGDRYVENSC